MRRRRWPVVLVALGVLALLGWYVAFTRQVVGQLREAAAAQGRMYSRIYRALLDTSAVGADYSSTLLELAEQVRQTGVPLVLTDAEGRVAAAANLPFEAALDDPRLREYVAELDRRNAPILEPGFGGVHYGDSPIVEGLRVIPLLQAAGIGLLLLVGAYALRERGRAEREKVWAGMAREAAHQLGTPLSSLAGWVELLQERAAADPVAERATRAMEQDLARLDRVSHRFERIGREPRLEPVDCGALVDRLAAYFAARAPTLARQVRITSEHPPGPCTVRGDVVLLEWVLEVLVKNAIDALGGRDGHVVVSATPLPEGGARLRVADDGPGVPRALRKRIFDAGFTTKDRGWGIGLALARRIVEENHGGRLVLADVDRGAAFDVILPA
jgi:signal transduction histidine kinase